MDNIPAAEEAIFKRVLKQKIMAGKKIKGKLNSGRPKIAIDKQYVLLRLSQGITIKEIASFYYVSPKTIRRRLKQWEREEEFDMCKFIYGNTNGDLDVHCCICGAKNVSLTRHHIKYHPEKVISVCKTCHGKIHSGNGYYENLKPEKNERLVTYIRSIKSRDLLQIMQKEINDRLNEVGNKNAIER